MFFGLAALIGFVLCLLKVKKIIRPSKMVFVQFIFPLMLINQFYNNVGCISFFHFTQDPPPVRDIALMSRYIVHHSGNISKLFCIFIGN